MAHEQMSEKVLEDVLGLSGERVYVEDLDKILHQRGVIVKVHIGRMRGNFELSPKLMGIKMTPSVRKFFRSYVQNGKLSFLDSQTVMELERIENRVRMMATRMSIGYDNTFMPIETYKEFKAYLEEQRRYYFQKRDEILSRWEELKINFQNTLIETLKDLHDLHASEEEIQKIFEGIMKKYPSKEAFRDSFYMKTSLRAFPIVENLTLFDEEISSEIKESAIKESLRLVREVIGVCLNDLFNAANQVHVALEQKSKLESRTKGSVKKTVSSVRRNNIFSHRKVEELASKLEELANTQDRYDGMELAEVVMAGSYGLAKELDLLEFIDLKDTNVAEDDLEILYQAYAS